MNVSTVEEVPQYPDSGIRSDKYSRLTRSSEGCEACAKCVPPTGPGRTSAKNLHGDPDRSARMQRACSGDIDFFADALLAELSGAVSAGRCARSVEMAFCWMHIEAMLHRLQAYRGSGCISAGRQTSLCFQTCGAVCSWSAIRSSAAQTSAMRPQISRHSGCLRGSRCTILRSRGEAAGVDSSVTSDCSSGGAAKA